MAQYIDKSALVAEIKERIETYNKGYANGDDRRANALEVLLNDIDTLEVKEVDLRKEMDKEWNKCKPIDEGMGLEIASIEHEQFDNISKHFFELGLKTQHSSIKIPNIDDIFEEDGIDPSSKEAKIFRESYYMALERLKAQKGE